MPRTGLPPRATAVLLALVAALLVLRLGAIPLLGPDEPRYTRVAVEMHRAGEWVRPTLQGEAWLEKPPLFYWLAGAAFSALGETEAAARLPPSSPPSSSWGRPPSSAPASAAPPPASTRASSPAPRSCPSPTAARRRWTCSSRPP